MSNIKRMLEKFESELEQTVVCPYCMEPNQIDPPLLCCHEVHAEECQMIPLNDGDWAFLDEEGKAEAFKMWLEEQLAEGGTK